MAMHVCRFGPCEYVMWIDVYLEEISCAVFSRLSGVIRVRGLDRLYSETIEGQCIYFVELGPKMNL